MNRYQQWLTLWLGLPGHHPRRKEQAFIAAQDWRCRSYSRSQCCAGCVATGTELPKKSQRWQLATLNKNRTCKRANRNPKPPAAMLEPTNWDWTSGKTFDAQSQAHHPTDLRNLQPSGGILERRPNYFVAYSAPLMKSKRVCRLKY